MTKPKKKEPARIVAELGKHPETLDQLKAFALGKYPDRSFSWWVRKTLMRAAGID